MGNQEQESMQQETKPQELPEMSAADLPEPLRQAMAQTGWQELMPVQAKTIPYILENRDVMVQSRTGSGKTGAFLLPLVERLDPDLKSCQALVLVPTRELARQVQTQAEILTRGSNLKSTAVYGGTGYGPQLQAFREGVQIVIGTPGRVLDHLIKKSLTLKDLHTLVFDEADRLLSMGFYPDMQRVRDFLPDHPINTMMFSATFPPRVMALGEQFLDHPQVINLSSDQIYVAETEHVYYVVPRMDKDRSLIRVIEAENPDSALIFCNTKARVNYVTIVLQRFGYNAEEISSDLNQNTREQVLSRIRKGELRFLVATDVAARGIDLPELSHVFIYEPPEHHEDYIHRAGRTGRAGAGGVAISLVNVLEEKDLRRIGHIYDIDFEQRELPSDEDIENIVAQRAIALLEARLRTRDRLMIERMERFKPLVRDLGDSDEELALITMLVDDFYQQAFHHPPEIEQTAEKRARRKSTGRPRSRRSGRRRSKR